MPKYQAFQAIALNDRTWPSRVIDKAPQWCSVDLRDGNQALINPMSVDQKLAMFSMLVKLGFKQIEIGFPSASQIEFDFARRLIEENRIPDDVSIQILCQAREELVIRSFEALKGAQKVIFHIYSSTSPAHRTYTFGMDKAQILDVAVKGIGMIKKHVSMVSGTELVLQYSPESFSQTEMDYAIEVCTAVHKAWGTDKTIILNLPATVEVCTASQHADQIEYFCRHIPNRARVIVSLHTHNDRGTGIAAAELALMAGADRVEGTLFGNGERTGNLDMVTMALNMYSQGVATGLDFSDLGSIARMYEDLTGMTIHPRHPYAGDLVFTAFSGSHQDAIKKALEKRNNRVAELSKQSGTNQSSADQQTVWDIPYLPIDPKDIGRSYDAIIRINSQSGKGGVAWVLKDNYGLDLPKTMQREFGKVVNVYADSIGTELASYSIWDLFNKTYLQQRKPWLLHEFHEDSTGLDHIPTSIRAKVVGPNGALEINASGNGPIEAFTQGLIAHGAPRFEITEFHENSTERGADGKAAAFVCLRIDGQEWWGCAVHASISIAGLEAVLNALNRQSQQ